jgi:hypothetical protein
MQLARDRRMQAHDHFLLRSRMRRGKQLIAPVVGALSHSLYAPGANDIRAPESANLDDGV